MLLSVAVELVLRTTFLLFVTSAAFSLDPPSGRDRSGPKAPLSIIDTTSTSKDTFSDENASRTNPRSGERSMSKKAAAAAMATAAARSPLSLRYLSQATAKEVRIEKSPPYFSPIQTLTLNASRRHGMHRRMHYSKGG